MFDNVQSKNNSNAINVNSMVDFTLLDARATNADIEKLCDIAYKNQYYSVCVNPINVSYAKGYILQNLGGELKVVTVIGFPLGANLTQIKVDETVLAIKDGADEIDVVINIGKAKSGNYRFIQEELASIKKLAKKRIVKAIIETCYFDENELLSLCSACVKSKIDYIKTSTGFGTGGATEHIISLIHREVAGKCKIKASGGIRTREQAVNLINLGANRIGTSHVI